jgi:hypothetical protein
MKTVTQRNGPRNSLDGGSLEDLVTFLEGKLDQHEKNLRQKQFEYDNLQFQHQDLQMKFEQVRQKYKRAAYLLTEFLDDLLGESPGILQTDKDHVLNLEKIKETPIEKLDKEDKISLVLVLLKQMQPYLSSQNLAVAPPHASVSPMTRNSEASLLSSVKKQ